MFYYTIICVSQPSSENLLAMDGGQHRDLQLVTVQRKRNHGVLNPIWLAHITVLYPKAQGSFCKSRQKDFKSHKWWITSKNQCFPDTTGQFMAIVTTCKRSVRAHAVMSSMDGGSTHRTSSLAKGLLTLYNQW